MFAVQKIRLNRVLVCVRDKNSLLVLAHTKRERMTLPKNRGVTSEKALKGKGVLCSRSLSPPVTPLLSRNQTDLLTLHGLRAT